MSERIREFEINGFLFRDEAAAQQAKREVEGIKYIRERNDLSNPAMVLKVYNKMIEQQLFETPVGIGYLKELQSYLKAQPHASKEEILPIPVLAAARKEEGDGNAQAEWKEAAGGQGKLRVSLAFNIVLVLAVIAMFVITLTSKHPTILNYENHLLNQYAGWEQELNEREQAIKEKERELNIQP